MANKSSAFIKSLRLQRNFSQLEIAEKLGISRSSYIAFEQGRRELSLAEANTLSRIFEVSIDDIQTGNISTPEIILEKNKKIKKTTTRLKNEFQCQERELINLNRCSCMYYLKLAVNPMSGKPFSINSYISLI